MFTKASLRLSIWYVAILMSLSLVFSVWLYAEATQEVHASLNAQLQHPYVILLPRSDVDAFINQQLAESNWRIVVSLAFMNAGVLVAGSFLSYFLARKTLAPIERALAAQNQFTADASHELRTPLAAMKSEIEVALRDKNLSASAAHDLLSSNIEEIDRLTKLSNDLLVLAGRSQQPQLKKVNISQIANKVCSRFDTVAAKKTIKIQREIIDVVATAQASCVDSIISILLDNAIKYAPKNAKVTLAVCRQDSQVVVTVHNTGTFISPEDLEHVFDRFYRVDKARTGGDRAGHGLGLAIAQKMAQDTNGKLAATSNKQTGTKFTLWLQIR